MRNILIVAFLLVNTISIAQEQGYPFEQKLEAATSKDSITLDLKRITAIRSIQRKDTCTQFDENSKWKLLYHRESGWRENMPNQRHNIDVLEVGKKDNVVLGQDILNIFQRFKQKVIILNHFPLEFSLMPRGAPLNGAFILVLLDDNNIVLQYTHSYPNGNQSSWYVTNSYYFKKIIP